ncbi:helix-turn-helix domain-containing protein [Mycobacterium senegalense]|uniref:helix-turn-helix domain-containing protein n=1 Tax=Mycolicibacterium senegalense TaxID=1796 RepID=UPI0022231782|nr:helix-turn-helix domain-containing protein [Mycolicibacterium senegalense]MCW1823154.1 helix-turn-helix domain-containing protein [Mycolicibacterium senegalense]
MTDTETYTADVVEATAEEIAETLRALDQSSTRMQGWIRSSFATPEEDPVLTAEEVAETLRISLRTTLDMLRAGAIEGTRIGRQWRIRKSALDALLNKPRPVPCVIVTAAVDGGDMLVIGPTGSGKSAIARELREQHPDLTVREIQIDGVSA